MSTEPYLNQLRSLLPPTWRADTSDLDRTAPDKYPDAVLDITAPDGTSSSLWIELKARLSARQAVTIASAFSTNANRAYPGQGIVFTRFASGMARRRLREAGISYLDLTGNVWISIDCPALFIERSGSETDPNPPRRTLRSLKGPKASRIVRALSDWRPPVGVRELARRTGTNPGYVTRVLSLLREEDVILRSPRGEVTEVRWQELIRRWSHDYSVALTNRSFQCLAPRGLTQFREGLARFTEPYALTGTFAVPEEAQILPGRLLSCYVANPERAAVALGAQATDSGANVLFLEPFDAVVFDRTREVGGLTAVALTQCTVDLLTGGGREPGQADSLMSWMAEHEESWRA